MVDLEYLDLLSSALLSSRRTFPFAIIFFKKLIILNKKKSASYLIINSPIKINTKFKVYVRYPHLLNVLKLFAHNTG